MGRNKKVKHDVCGGMVTVVRDFMDGRDYGFCSRCDPDDGFITWLNDTTVELTPPDELERERLLAIANKQEQDRQAHKYDFEKVVHHHVGDYSWEGKLIFCQQCECKFCMKRKEKDGASSEPEPDETGETGETADAI